MTYNARYSCIAALLLFAACDSDASNEEGVGEGSPTWAVCPTGRELSYTTFGRDFMAKYSTRCHDASKTDAAGTGAPPNHNFNTLDGVLAMAEHIDITGAAGPDASNTVMPPDGDRPSEAERRLLGEWLACELAK